MKTSDLSPYISPTSRITYLEIHRCAIAFLSSHLHTFSLLSHSLAHCFYLGVSTHLCLTLFLILNEERLTFNNQSSMIKKLVESLSWPESGHCTPACELDEVNFTAIWPWRSRWDVERPSFKNGRGFWIRGGIGIWMGSLLTRMVF